MRIFKHILALALAAVPASPAALSQSPSDTLVMTELLSAPVHFYDDVMAGRVAGVSVTTADGAPGRMATVLVRGANSLALDSSPLYVIDGFATRSSHASALNPADIVSITVLKDAAALALYGSRGANGVVLIETRRGDVGKVTVDLSAGVGAEGVSKRLGLSGTGIDWQDKVFRTGLTSNFSATVSGGNNAAGNHFLVSISGLDRDGTLKDTGYKRYQARMSYDQRINKRLSFDFGANFSRSVWDGTDPTVPQIAGSATGYLMWSVLGYRPADDSELVSSGIDRSSDYSFNPVSTLEHEHVFSRSTSSAGHLGVNWKIADGLDLRVAAQYDLDKLYDEEFHGSRTSSGSTGSGSGMGLNGAVYETNLGYWNAVANLHWVKSFGDGHNIDARLAAALDGENSSFRGHRAKNVTTESLGVFGLNNGTYLPVVDWTRDWTLLGLSASVGWNWRQLYFLSASFGADGYSGGTVSRSFETWPSVSAAWAFGREEALSGLGWLSDGRVHLSWGKSGNSRTDTGYKDLYDREITTALDGGVSVGLLDGRMSAEVDLYSRDTKDVLVPVADASGTAGWGYFSPSGSISNKGLELSLSGWPVKGESFSWEAYATAAFNRNRVEDLGGASSLGVAVSWDDRYASEYPYMLQTGESIGSIWGYDENGTAKTLGCAMPDAFGGFGSVLSFGAWDVRAHFTWSCGADVINAGKLATDGTSSPGVYTSGWVEDASYVRLKYLTVGYTLPQQLISKLRMREARVCLSAENLLTLTGYSGYDPEVSTLAGYDGPVALTASSGSGSVSVSGLASASGSASGSAAASRTVINKVSNVRSADGVSLSGAVAPGFDWSSYPRALGVTLGLQVRF